MVGTNKCFNNALSVLFAFASFNSRLSWSELFSTVLQSASLYLLFEHRHRSHSHISITAHKDYFNPAVWFNYEAKYCTYGPLRPQQTTVPFLVF